MMDGVFAVNYDPEKGSIPGIGRNFSIYCGAIDVHYPGPHAKSASAAR
jgi:hypothetical protein